MPPGGKIYDVVYVAGGMQTAVLSCNVVESGQTQHKPVDKSVAVAVVAGKVYGVVESGECLFYELVVCQAVVFAVRGSAAFCDKMKHVAVKTQRAEACAAVISRRAFKGITAFVLSSPPNTACFVCCTDIASSSKPLSAKLIKRKIIFTSPVDGVVLCKLIYGGVRTDRCNPTDCRPYST